MPNQFFLPGNQVFESVGQRAHRSAAVFVLDLVEQSVLHEIVHTSVAAAIGDLQR